VFNNKKSLVTNVLSINMKKGNIYLNFMN
jgi:hypothetical protein